MHKPRRGGSNDGRGQGIRLESERFTNGSNTCISLNNGLPSTLMNAESFSKITSGIQSIAVVIALVVGGWWALKTFTYQNPAFYEWGFQQLGYDPRIIKTELSLENLNPPKRQYEITLTLTSASKTLFQTLRAEDIEVLYFHPGQTTPMHATFSSLSSPHTVTHVPVLESRQIRFLAEFPEDGVYVVETDLCKRNPGNNCLAQKYVSVIADKEKTKTTLSSTKN